MTRRANLNEMRLAQGVIESYLSTADKKAEYWNVECNLGLVVDTEADDGAFAVRVAKELQRQRDLAEDFGGSK